MGYSPVKSTGLYMWRGVIPFLHVCIGQLDVIITNKSEGKARPTVSLAPCMQSENVRPPILMLIEHFTALEQTRTDVHRPDESKNIYMQKIEINTVTIQI